MRARPIGRGLGDSALIGHGAYEVGQADERCLGPFGPSGSLRGPDEPKGQDGVEQHGADDGNADHIVRKTSEPVAAVER